MSGVTGGTLTVDIPRVGKDIDWTGATGSPTFVMGGAMIYGSLKLISGMTYTGSGTLNLKSRSTGRTITTAGKTMQSMTFNAVGGEYTLQDAITINGTFTLNYGSFIKGSHDMTAQRYVLSGTEVRSFSGSGNIYTTTTSATSVWDITTATNLTLDVDDATIIVQGVTSNTRSFVGGDQVYGTLNYTLSGSTGTFDILGSNSFAAIQFSDATNARSLRFTAGTTTTIRTAAGWQVNGASGRLITIGSTTSATHYISVPSGTVESDYLSISRSTALGGATFYAGANSVYGGVTHGWIFTDVREDITAKPFGLNVGQEFQSGFNSGWPGYVDQNTVTEPILNQFKGDVRLWLKEELNRFRFAVGDYSYTARIP